MVICTWFGPRRAMNNNAASPEDSLKTFQYHVDKLKTVDPGMERDVILVNNQAGNHPANVYLDSLHQTECHSGKFICHTRENLGASFGAYNYGWQQHKEEYDLWCFLEDDVMLTEDGLFPKAEEVLRDPGVGFVPLAPLAQFYGIVHSGGGCGWTTSGKIEQVQRNNRISRSNGSNYVSWERAEIEFTGQFTRKGLELRHLPGVSPLCSNYKTHVSQAQHLRPEWLDMRTIYQVGI